MLCALPSEVGGPGPECSCCIGLGSLQEAAQAEEAGPGGATRLETTGGRLTRWSKNHAAKIEGCGDYQLFWDR